MKTRLTKEEALEQLKALAANPDREIDYSDIPETTNLTGWHRFHDRKMFKPVKIPVNLRMDADVLEWLKTHKNYTTLVNNICREKMREELKRA